jgi:peptidoglycan/xylan/chitin deacetylase (PgdA/CDA1 family)
MHLPKDHAFGILMYHRVAARTRGVAKPTWNVTPERFRRQLDGLLSRGYHAWSLQRVLACRQTGEPIPPHVFVVTFDDGYECVYHDAWPILKELAVPATIFVTTAYLDAKRHFPFDDWAAAGLNAAAAATWRPLSTQQCVEMVQNGLVEIGSHTHTHADFIGRDEVFRLDLAQSRELLQERFGLDRPTFAFPFGQHNPELVEIVRESGMACALTAEAHCIAPQAEPFAWGRFNVCEWDDASTLVFKLSGGYTYLRKAWHWLRRPWRAGCASFQKAPSCVIAATSRGVASL